MRVEKEAKADVRKLSSRINQSIRDLVTRKRNKNICEAKRNETKRQPEAALETTRTERAQGKTAIFNIGNGCKTSTTGSSSSARDPSYARQVDPLCTSIQHSLATYNTTLSKSFSFSFCRTCTSDPPVPSKVCRKRSASRARMHGLLVRVALSMI